MDRARARASERTEELTEEVLGDWIARDPDRLGDGTRRIAEGPEEEVEEHAQVQDPAWGTFRLPNLVVAVDGRRVTVPVDGPVTTFELRDVRKAPASVVVDPDGWWLLEAKVEERR